MATFGHLTFALHPPLPDGSGFGGTGRTKRMKPTALSGAHIGGLTRIAVSLVAKALSRSRAAAYAHTVMPLSSPCKQTAMLPA